jgi:hypothetical protein
MHYWSVDDRERFLTLLEERNGEDGRNYVMQRVNGPRYSLAISQTVSPVTIICLDAAPFGAMSGDTLP